MHRSISVVSVTSVVVVVVRVVVRSGLPEPAHTSAEGRGGLEFDRDLDRSAALANDAHTRDE
jgi:hypothetical protein